MSLAKERFDLLRKLRAIDEELEFEKEHRNILTDIENFEDVYGDNNPQKVIKDLLDLRSQMSDTIMAEKKKSGNDVMDLSD